MDIADKAGKAVKMMQGDFYYFKSRLSQSKIVCDLRALLADVYIVHFRRDDTTMYLKNHMMKKRTLAWRTSSSKQQKSPCGSENTLPQFRLTRKAQQGVAASRKKRIVDKLPADRSWRWFW